MDDETGEDTGEDTGEGTGEGTVGRRGDAAVRPPARPAAGTPRVGLVGLGGMGRHLAAWCARAGLAVVAGCEPVPERRAAAAALLPTATLLRDWAELLDRSTELALDGVVLANDFDAHAAPAVAFLERGIHVLSECAACTDEAEGDRLLRAVAAGPATYSFAENYVAHPHIRLIADAVAAGEVGRPTLVEAEYLHGMAPDDVAALVGDPAHWRGRIAPTAYCTHTLSPVLTLTGARPTEVTAFPADLADPRAAVVLVVRLSTGALAVTRHGFLQGEPDSHWSWLSVRGTRGLVESVRGAGERAWSVRLRQEAWASGSGHVRDEERVPPPLHTGTGDAPGTLVPRRNEGTFRVLAAWRRTLLHGAEPLVGAGAAVDASLVGVAGARSLASGSQPVPIRARALP